RLRWCRLRQGVDGEGHDRPGTCPVPVANRKLRSVGGCVGEVRQPDRECADDRVRVPWWWASYRHRPAVPAVGGTLMYRGWLQLGGAELTNTSRLIAHAKPGVPQSWEEALAQCRCANDYIQYD